MSGHDIRKFKKGKEFVAEAERLQKRGEPVSIRGSKHIVVSMPLGSVAVSNHPKDLPLGTRNAIVEAFIRIGLASFAIVAFWAGATLLNILQAGAPLIGVMA